MLRHLTVELRVRFFLPKRSSSEVDQEQFVLVEINDEVFVFDVGVENIALVDGHDRLDD